MIRTLHQKRFFFLFALMFVLSACGWAEWPPPEDGPRATNRPQTSGGSATAFVNADAVIVGKGDTVYVMALDREAIVQRISRKRQMMVLLMDAKQVQVPFTEIWEASG